MSQISIRRICLILKLALYKCHIIIIIIKKKNGVSHESMGVLCHYGSIGINEMIPEKWIQIYIILHHDCQNNFIVRSIYELDYMVNTGAANGLVSLTPDHL